MTLQYQIFSMIALCCIVNMLPAQQNPSLRRSNQQTATPVRQIQEPEMILIKGGFFMMGCLNDQDTDCKNHEKPARRVEIKNFFLSRYEVTQALWRSVMDNSPSYNASCNECPVEQVSWNDVQEFLRKLNEITGKQYRLPSEAEWEYAARGGSNGLAHRYAGGNDVNEIAWYNANARVNNPHGTRGTTRPVGNKQANELGLHDLSGNVWEWVADDWHGNYNGAPTDGSAWIDSPNRGAFRVARGGSWFNPPAACRPTARDYHLPTIRSPYVGFRLALSE